ncbi:MAG: PHP domain-containing protein [Candidatus Ranarchaeia archaeon]
MNFSLHAQLKIEEKCWKVDFHVHTCASHDGVGTPKEMVDAAIRKGLDAIAITDHDTIKGLPKAIEYARRLTESQLLVIPGIEVSTENGHILGIGISEPIQSHLSPELTIKKIHSLGGLAIPAHPFDSLRAGCGNKINIITTRIDAVEVLNGGIVLPWANHRAKRWSRLHNIVGIGGSDAHMPEVVGCALTLIQKDNSDKQCTFDMIKRKLLAGYVQPWGRTTTLKEKLMKEWRRINRHFAYKKPCQTLDS